MVFTLFGRVISVSDHLVAELISFAAFVVRKPHMFTSDVMWLAHFGLNESGMKDRMYFIT